MTSEEGCRQLLKHADADNILSKLVDTLGWDEAGRGMNAAFAIGRLCDVEQGRSRLLELPNSESMVSETALFSPPLSSLVLHHPVSFCFLGDTEKYTCPLCLLLSLLFFLFGCVIVFVCFFSLF